VRSITEKALEGAPERGDIHLDLAALYAERRDSVSAERHVRLARTKGQEPPEELLRVLEALSNRPE
jgi:hypothetical protein